MSGTRRRFFQDAAAFGAGLFGLSEALRAGTPGNIAQSPHENERARHHSPYGSYGPHQAQSKAAMRDHALSMVTPDVPDLPHEIDEIVFKLADIADVATRAGCTMAADVDREGFHSARRQRVRERVNARA